MIIIIIIIAVVMGKEYRYFQWESNEGRFVVGMVFQREPVNKKKRFRVLLEAGFLATLSILIVIIIGPVQQSGTLGKSLQPGVIARKTVLCYAWHLHYTYTKGYRV